MARNITMEHQSASAQPRWLLDLPDNCIEHIVELLPANEVACSLRLVTTETARKLDKPTQFTVRIRTYNEGFSYVPSIVPSHAVAARWGAPGAARGLALTQRKGLLCCMARSGGDHSAFLSLAEALGCKVEVEVLTAAAGGGHAGLCAQLLQQLMPSLKDNMRRSGAVAAAAGNGHLEVVQLLATGGLGVNTSLSGCAGADPMASAAIGGHLHICKWLAGNGWDPTEANSAFCSAAKQGKWEAATYIRSLAKGSIRSSSHVYVAYGCSLEALEALCVEEAATWDGSPGHGIGTKGSSGGRGGETVWQEQQQAGGARAWVQQLDQQEQGLLLAYAAASPTPNWQAKVEWVLQQGVTPDLSSCQATDVLLRECDDVTPRVTWLEGRGISVGWDTLAALFSRYTTAKRLPLLQQLLSKGRGESVRDGGLAHGGDLELLKALAGAATSSKRLRKLRKHAAECGAEAGHLHVVRWAVGEEDEEGGDAGAAVLPRPGNRLSSSSSSSSSSSDGTDSSCSSSDSESPRSLQQRTGAYSKRKKSGLAGVGARVRRWLSCSMFTEAIQTGNCELVRWLRAHGCKWPEGALATAAASCSEELVEWMVRQEGCPAQVRGPHLMTDALPAI